MEYYSEKNINYSFEKALERVKSELKKEDFGILTEVDMHNTFKEKFDIDFRKYKILQVCNPPSSFKSVLKKDKLGIILPCNIIIQEVAKKQTVVTITKPIFSMKTADDAESDNMVNDLEEKLGAILDKL